HSVRRIPEFFFSLLIDVALANCRNRNFQPFASFFDGIAKKFALCSVNQRMRRENIRKTWQRATRCQKYGGTHHMIMAPLQFPDHAFDSCESQALGDLGTIGNIFLGLSERER